MLGGSASRSHSEAIRAIVSDHSPCVVGGRTGTIERRGPAGRRQTRPYIGDRGHLRTLVRLKVEEHLFRAGGSEEGGRQGGRQRRGWRSWSWSWSGCVPSDCLFTAFPSTSNRLSLDPSPPFHLLSTACQWPSVTLHCLPIATAGTDPTKHT